MGFYDEIGDDDDEAAAPPISIAQPGRSPAARAKAPPRLRAVHVRGAEIAAGRRACAEWGRLSERVAHSPPPLQHAFYTLLLDRALRRLLAALSLDPSDIFPAMFGGLEAPRGRGPEVTDARIFAHAWLTVFRDERGPLGQAAAGLLAALALPRPEAGWDPAEDSRHLVAAILSARSVWTQRFQTCDHFFALTDFAADYGAELNYFPLDHMPDDEAATDFDRVFESLRRPKALPAPLRKIRATVGTDLMLPVFDLAAGLAIATDFGCVPLTGIIRRDLFQHDLHYPADLSAVLASFIASLRQAERDYEQVRNWSVRDGRVPGRLQLGVLVALSLIGRARKASLARLLQTSWQALSPTLAELGSLELVEEHHGTFFLRQTPVADRSIHARSG